MGAFTRPKTLFERPVFILNGLGAAVRRNSQYGFEKTGDWAAAVTSRSCTAVVFTASGSENTTRCDSHVGILRAGGHGGCRGGDPYWGD